MNLTLSLLVILTAVAAFFSPFVCDSVGAPIGILLWIMFVVPVLLVLVNLLDDTKAYFLAYGQAILVAVVVVVSCIDSSMNRARRNERRNEIPPPGFVVVSSM